MPHTSTDIRPPRTPYIVDPLAFFAALIGAPLIVALLGFWALMIPVFAVVFGAPLYLALGAPILLWALPRFGPRKDVFAMLAFISLICACAVAAIVPVSVHGIREQTLNMYLSFGAFMAPLWGYAFGVLYTKFERTAFGALNFSNSTTGD